MTQIIKIKNKGFTLIEMAVVLTIMGVVTYAILNINSAQVEMGKIRETQAKMRKIENAITTYFMMNGYLPCPASGSVATGNVLYGKEDVATRIGANTSGVTNVSCPQANYASSALNPDIYSGVVPFRDLNIPQEDSIDAWNNRITYVVSRPCVASDNWQTPGSPYRNRYKCSLNGLTTGTDASPNSTSGAKIQISSPDSLWMTTEPYAAYVLISHGNGGDGAWNRTGVRMKVSSGLSDSDKNNANIDLVLGTAKATNDALTVYYNSPYIGPTQDDILHYRTAPQIYYDATH